MFQLVNRRLKSCEAQKSQDFIATRLGTHVAEESHDLRVERLMSYDTY